MAPNIRGSFFFFSKFYFSFFLMLGRFLLLILLLLQFLYTVEVYDTYLWQVNDIDFSVNVSRPRVIINFYQLLEGVEDFFSLS